MTIPPPPAERPLRIHWVSPLPPQQTDIAHYTRRMLPALAERAEVVLWTDESGWDPELESFARVRMFDPGATIPMDLRGFSGEGGTHVDAVFLNIGNSHIFHAGILKLAQRVPGIVVIHDLAIQEFLCNAVRHGMLEARAYHEAMARHYGKAGRAASRHILDHGATPELLDAMPMFEIALTNAAAALCHTPAGFERIAATGLVPAFHADLPFAVGPKIDAARAGAGPLKLVQFGHISPNRRLEPILEALGQIRHEVDFVFDIFGKLWDPEHVARKATEHGIADRLRFRGFAPEPELDAAIREAHLVFNLRYPTMGEASGSQLRIWNASAAAVVTDLGWYASIPDDAAVKIPLETEVASLAQTLRHLNADRPAFARIGAAGRDRLLGHHTPERYAEALVACARHAEADARERLFVNAATRALDASPAQCRHLYARAMAGVVG